MIGRAGGKSCVAALAYRGATRLLDNRTGIIHDYTNKPNVGHVEFLIPEGAPSWIAELTEKCETFPQYALQNFSDICEAVERRKDSQVYREVEFSLPNELTDEQNIAWANEFLKNVFVKRGMVVVANFHFDVDETTGIAKPHCHAVMTTRHLTEEGFGLKNLEWNKKDLIIESREQYASYQNAYLKQHGFEVRVSHLSYADRGLDIDPQPKLSRNIREMVERGIATYKQKSFELARLKCQLRAKIS